jgi:CheY-like chemotaxis protein
MAEPAGNELVITVRDNGPGIAREDWEPIFESFQQGRRGAPSEEGTGLGLTLCRKIMTLLGGRIWLESEVGMGSAFHVAMPFEKTVAEASTGTGERVDGRSVVIIDDDRASQELLTAYLVGTGVQVVRARDGTEGLGEIRRRRPVAVVLDILLPGIDGWAVLDELRSDETTRDVPVIIVSILDEKSRGLALGAASYLTKPVSREDLIEALRDVKVLSA